MKSSGLAGTTLCLVLGSCVASVAGAAVDLTLRAGDTYTDNVSISGSSPQDEHIAGVATTVSLATQRQRLEARVTADLTYLDYLHNTYDNQFRRGVDANLKLNFFNGQLAWILTENYGAVLEDPLSAERPDNLSYDNYLTTGPQLTIGELTRLHARASMQYSRADFGSKDVPDNEQYSGDFAIILPASLVSESSLNVRTRRIRQDPEAELVTSAFDYDLGEAFLRLTRRAARSEMYVEAGGSRLDASGDSSTTPLARAGITRKLTPRLSLQSTMGIQYQDSLGRFQRLQDPDAAGPGGISDPRDDVIDSASPMRDRFIDAALSFEGARTNAYLSLSYNRVGFERSADPLGEQKYSSVSVGVQRRIRPTWTLDLVSEYNRRNLGEFGRRDENVLVHIGSTWHLQPKLDLKLSLFRRERHSNALDGDYKVNYAQLEVIYWPRRASRAGQG